MSKQRDELTHKRHKLHSLPFTQTRFADQSMIWDLGIDKDVSLIFRNLGLENFYEMESIAFWKPTCDLLATAMIERSRQNGEKSFPLTFFERGLLVTYADDTCPKGIDEPLYFASILARSLITFEEAAY